MAKKKAQSKKRPSSDGDKKKIQLRIGPPKEPKYDLKLLAPGSPDQQMLEDVRHDLVEMKDGGGAGFFVFANCMGERDLVGEDGGPPKCVTVLKPNTAIPGDFLVGFNMNIYRRLSHSARREILKMQMMRIPYGHFSERMKDMTFKYGQEIAERASQLVLAQSINPAILAEEGVVLPVPEMWEFDRNLTTEEYCHLLSEEGGGQMPMPKHFFIQDSAKGGQIVQIGGKADPELQKELQKLLDEKGFTKLDNLDITNSTEADALDEASRNFLDKVDTALQSQDSDLKSQGFMGGEATEFIEQLNKEPSVAWTSRVRAMHSRHLSTKRIMAAKKPSRRGGRFRLPDGGYYSFYKGRRHDRAVTMLFIIDTSGSMSAQELSLIDAELRAIKNSGATVLILQVDACVAKEPIAYMGPESVSEFAGRGGTSFVPGFEYAHEMSPRPDYIVYYTDGWGNAPDEESEIDTLWLLTPDGLDEDEFTGRVCEWGETAKVTYD